MHTDPQRQEVAMHSKHIKRIRFANSDLRLSVAYDDSCIFGGLGGLL